MSSELNEPPVAKPLEFLLERYEDISAIGSGAMGDVYKARDKKLRLNVAVKVLSKQMPSDKDIVRFHREAKAYGKCNHENLVKILDFGVTPASEPYLIMEFFDGENVDDLIVSRSAPPTKAELPAWIEIFIQVCRGMDHAHKNGIVHRDIKTRNIMVSGLPENGQPDGPANGSLKGKPVVKIIDFGLAKIEDYAGDATLTKAGAVVGSPLYLSPEQAGGNKADRRSDIYSFGCVMYFALTGQLPFRGDTPLATIRGHLKETPKPLKELNEAVDGTLEAIVLRCLEKSPDNRYQSMGELADDLSKRLEKVIPDTISSSSTSSTTSSPPSSAQKKLSAQKIAVAVMIVGCMFAAAFWFDLAIKNRLLEREKASKTESAAQSLVDPAADPADDSVETSAIWTDADSKFRTKIYGQRLYIQPKDERDITDEDLKEIDWSKLDKQKHVEIDLSEAVKITGRGLHYLPAARVYSIRLTRAAIADSAFSYIAQMSNLENLTLTYSHVTFEGIRQLIGLKNLHSLHLGYCPKIDDRAAYFAINTWPDLTHLSFAGTRITRGPIKEIVKLKHLEELSLSDTPATDDDVIPLTGIKMTELYLNHCPITDKSLPAFEKMPNLKVLGIWGCTKVSKQALDNLRSNRQDVKLPGEPPKEYVDFYFSDEIH